jgi:hypothetical protein
MGLIDYSMWKFDEGVTGFFGQWNSYSTAIATALVLLVSIAVYSRQEPDTHPMLLARQASAAPVRAEGESPIYRSHSAPHGMPLATGLAVRDAGAMKWSRGRDGDLRDIWRRAAGGAPEGEGPKAGAKGTLLTVLGKERVLVNNFGKMK